MSLNETNIFIFIFRYIGYSSIAIKNVAQKDFRDLWLPIKVSKVYKTTYEIHVQTLICDQCR